jgi:exonuclease SbcC
VRLHRLTLRAVGPFAGEEIVDFDALSASGLFLLEGPTGAGKSTVLDAITFALYGGVAGTTGSKDRLHSDFAAPDVHPQVELEFSVGDRRHRVVRSPSHERPKLRGEGMRTVNGTVMVSVIEPDGTERVVSSRIAEADAEILRVLGGLTRSQFCQVVILPQGEFATFLRATADERRELLQRLFDADHFERVERVLTDLSRKAGAERVAANAAIIAAVVRATEAAGQADPHEVNEFTSPSVVEVTTSEPTELAGLPDGELVAALARTDARLRADAELVAAVASDATSTATAAATEVAATLAAQRWQQERATLRARSATLTVAAPEHERAVLRLGAADTAAVVSPAIVADDNARSSFDQQKSLIDIAILRAEQLPSGPDSPTGEAEWLPSKADRTDSKAWQQAASEAERTAATLSDAAIGEVTLQVTVTELSAQEQVAAELTESLAEVTARQASLPELITTVTGRLEMARQAQLRTQELRPIVQQAGQISVAADRLPLLRADAVAQLATHLEAVARSQDIVDVFQRLLQRRLEGMAAELATRLIAGEPCGVCGALEHPTPATASADAVSEQDLAQAERDRQQAELTVQAAAQAEVAAQALTDQVERESQGQTAEQATRHWGELQAELTATQQLAATAGEFLVAHEALVAERTSGEGDIGRLTAERVAIEQLLALQRAANVDLALQIAKYRNGYPTISSRVEVLGARAVIAAEVAAALVVQGRHLAALAECERALAEALAAAGFVDRQAAEQAILSMSERRDLLAQITDHVRDLSVVQDGLGRPELRDLSELPITDSEVAELMRVQEQAAAYRDDRMAMAGVAAQRVTRFSACQQDVHRVLERRRTVLEATAAVIRVARAAAGDVQVNSRRMTLSTYVLRERFAAVVAAASERLGRMSSSRYLLERDEDPSGNRKAGLGLGVIDAWTGQRRDTHTLSGGEAFYTSLALALGLADVVRAEAGGVDLQTLFVDEGFGSLDPERLDEVLDVLDELRDGGRVVGIVSHVSELKERIPDRLEVRRRPDGSSLLRVSG